MFLTMAEMMEREGKVESEDVMLIDNTIYERGQFEEFAEGGYFGKRIAKRGWKPTHKQVWTWKIQSTRFQSTPSGYTLVRADMHLEAYGE